MHQVLERKRASSSSVGVPHHDKGETARLIKAIAFASHKHRDHRRKDAPASPYINHPIALTDLLVNVGQVFDNEVLCAAVLHDTIEDTDTTADELKREFGAKIAHIVVEVTDDKTLPKAERKQHQIDHAPHASPQAKLVKLADKICNLRDIVDNPPAKWSLQRKREYFDWAAKVVAGLRGTHAPLEAVFDALYARRDELR